MKSDYGPPELDECYGVGFAFLLALPVSLAVVYMLGRIVRYLFGLLLS